MQADPRIPWNYLLPNNNLFNTMEECISALARKGINWTVGSGVDDDNLWCNATWDTFLCWPPIPANTSITLPCPAMKGLDPKRGVTKRCGANGVWAGRPGQLPTNSGDVGWANYTVCFTEELHYIAKNLDAKSLEIAQEVARKARNIEFVGLGLSLVSLSIAIAIFIFFRRLHVFRHMVHLHLMIGILMVAIIRLIIYIDLVIVGQHKNQTTTYDGFSINHTPVLCETMYFLLEYFKTVSFLWFFIAGFHLHNMVVLNVFHSDPKLFPYIIFGYVGGFIHTLGWLLFVFWRRDYTLERCLGYYYLETDFWLLNGPRMAEIVINLVFIFNVMRVLWYKVGDNHLPNDMERLWIRARAILMLVFILGVPNIMQTIPFSPTRDNIEWFAIWTYFASVTYMYQGLLIAVIFCFMNNEVQTVLKNAYYRHRLQHTSANDLIRGSRSVASRYIAKNGQVKMTMLNGENNNDHLSPQQTGRNKKGSGDSTTKLMLSAPGHEESMSNGYGTTATERTPLNEAEEDEHRAKEAEAAASGRFMPIYIPLAL